MTGPFTADSVALYDAIYTRKKNYREEADKIRASISAARPGAKTLLDVACGTAEHAKYLKTHYKVDGTDISEDFLEFARRKNPECGYYRAEMSDFDLGRRYDVVMNLFSSIGYMLTRDKLRAAIGSFARHLEPGGLLLVEPWFTPDQWKVGSTHLSVVDEPDLKVARMNVCELRQGYSYFNWHHLVGTREGVRHYTEEHTMALYTVEEMTDAFVANGLRVRHDPVGIFGRGLYIAEK